MVVWQLLALAAAAMVLPVAVPWLGFVFTVAIGKGLAALGVAMLLRGGLISIGHALFVAIGAYATAFLMLSIGMNELFLLFICATAITMAGGAGDRSVYGSLSRDIFCHAQSRHLHGVLHFAIKAL